MLYRIVSRNEFCVKGNTAQLRLRVSAAFLPHFRSSKNGKYIQYSSIFGTLNWGKNSG